MTTERGRREGEAPVSRDDFVILFFSLSYFFPHGRIRSPLLGGFVLPLSPVLPEGKDRPGAPLLAHRRLPPVVFRAVAPTHALKPGVDGAEPTLRGHPLPAGHFSKKKITPRYFLKSAFFPRLFV